MYAIARHVEALQAKKRNHSCRKRLAIEKKLKESVPFVRLAYYMYVDSMSRSEEKKQFNKVLQNANFD